MNYEEFNKLHKELNIILKDHLLLPALSIPRYMKDFIFISELYNDDEDYVDEVDRLAEILLFKSAPGETFYHTTYELIGSVYRFQLCKDFYSAIAILDLLVSNMELFIEHHIGKEGLSRIIFKSKI